jgi:hypothetical protein
MMQQIILDSIYYEIYRLQSTNSLLNSVLLSSMKETEVTNAMWVVNDSISDISDNLEELCGSLVIESEKNDSEYEYVELQNIIHSWANSN